MTHRTIRISHLQRITISFVLAGWAWAGDRSPEAEKAMAAAAARQRQAVASMAPSIEAQRQSLLRQGVPTSAVPFFSLPPLPSLPAATSPPTTTVAQCPPLPLAQLDPLISEAARRENLEPELLRSVIRQESGARPCAVSTKGAMGLMQLMPGTASELGVADAFNPKENVDAGARFLKQLLDLYGGDTTLALGAFNAGPSRVSQAGGLPDFPETLDYVQKVMAFLP